MRPVSKIRVDVCMPPNSAVNSASEDSRIAFTMILMMTVFYPVLFLLSSFVFHVNGLPSPPVTHLDNVSTREDQVSLNRYQSTKVGGQGDAVFVENAFHHNRFEYPSTQVDHAEDLVSENACLGVRCLPVPRSVSSISKNIVGWKDRFFHTSSRASSSRASSSIPSSASSGSTSLSSSPRWSSAATSCFHDSQIRQSCISLPDRLRSRFQRLPSLDFADIQPDAEEWKNDRWVQAQIRSTQSKGDGSGYSVEMIVPALRTQQVRRRRGQ
jgi:hypothetical protein